MTKLERECRYLTSILVKVRDNYTCQKCGRSADQGYKIDAAHIRPKGKYRLIRFLLDNIIALCFNCHFNWWHNSGEGGLKWFQDKYPDRWQKIEIAEGMRCKVDLKELVTALRLEVKRCGGEEGNR